MIAKIETFPLRIPFRSNTELQPQLGEIKTCQSRITCSSR